MGGAGREVGQIMGGMSEDGGMLRRRKDGLSERLAVKWKQRPPSVCTTSFFSAASIMILINRSSLDDLPRSFSIFFRKQFCGSP